MDVQQEDTGMPEKERMESKAIIRKEEEDQEEDEDHEEEEEIAWLIMDLEPKVIEAANKHLKTGHLWRYLHDLDLEVRGNKEGPSL